MQALTFLDFSAIATTSKNSQARLDQKDKQIQILTQEIMKLKENESLAKSDLDDMRKITREINENLRRLNMIEISTGPIMILIDIWGLGANYLQY